MVAVVDMGKRAVNEQTSKRILTGEERIVMSVTEAAKIMGGRRGYEKAERSRHRAHADRSNRDRRDRDRG